MRARKKTQTRRVPQQERSKQTVQWLLDATAEVLAQHGYADTTTNHIAHRAGVNIASLYQFFPSKVALVRTLVERHTQGLVEAMAAEISQTLALSPHQAIRRLIKTIFGIVAKDEAYNRTIIRDVPRLEVVNPILSMRRQFVNLVAGVMATRTDLKVRDAQQSAFIIVHAVQALIDAALVEDPVRIRDEEFMEEVSLLITRYLGIEPEAAPSAQGTRPLSA